jgi:hypothetical protein
MNDSITGSIPLNPSQADEQLGRLARLIGLAPRVPVDVYSLPGRSPVELYCGVRVMIADWVPVGTVIISSMIPPDEGEGEEAREQREAENERRVGIIYNLNG